MHYQIFFLNPEYKLAHDDDAEVLFEGDDICKVGVEFERIWQETGKDIGIYMPINGSYTDYHQNRRRDSKGRFI